LTAIALRKEVIRTWLWRRRCTGRLSFHQRVSNKDIATKSGEYERKAHKQHPQHV
jgi:hypothetical protein